MMSDKIQVWKCEECAQPKPCGRFASFIHGSTYEPKGCNFALDGDVVPVWKLTNGFEVRKRSPGLTTSSEPWTKVVIDDKGKVSADDIPQAFTEAEKTAIIATATETCIAYPIAFDGIIKTLRAIGPVHNDGADIFSLIQSSDFNLSPQSFAKIGEMLHQEKVAQAIKKPLIDPELEKEAEWFAEQEKRHGIYSGPVSAAEVWQDHLYEKKDFGLSAGLEDDDFHKIWFMAEENQKKKDLVEKPLFDQLQEIAEKLDLVAMSQTDGTVTLKPIKFDTKAPSYEMSPKKADELQEILLSGWPTSQTPNCAICRWISAEYPKDLILTEKGLLPATPINYDCLAQGGQDANSCYNSENCKALFEVEETAPSIVKAERIEILKVEIKRLIDEGNDFLKMQMNSEDLERLGKNE